jgi:hypothetical protein
MAVGIDLDRLDYYDGQARDRNASASSTESSEEETMDRSDQLRAMIRNLWGQIQHLRKLYPHRRFTLDGRIVGDIGEVVAETLFDLTLDEKSRKTHDAVAGDGRQVSIKASFQNHLTFTATPEAMIGILLREDGGHEVVYNGPGRYIEEAYGHRAGFGAKLLRLPASRLREINEKIPSEERIDERKTARR